MKEKILELLKAKFSATHAEVLDQSRSHAGHIEARKSGGGHYSVLIVSEKFAELSRIERHRMVYDKVFEAFPGAVHALAVKAYTPEEWASINKKD